MAKRYLLTLSLLFCCSILLTPAFRANSHTYSEKGLSFIRNIGQVTDQHLNHRTDIDFKIPGGNGLNIFISGNAIHYQWAKAETLHTKGKAGSGKSPSAAPIDEEQYNQPIAMYRMDVLLLGANPNARYTVDQPTNFQERYYTLGLEGKVANGYSKITYQEVYPHIDWVFYFNAEGKLEHDFIVMQGGKVSDIRLKYSGTATLKVNGNGSLTAVTPMGSVTENAPVTYQQENKRSIASAFVLEGDILSFSTAAYKGTLVIDPTLEWATYFGDIAYDEIRTLVTGKDNSIYVTGSTSSMANIATTGAHQTSYGGGSNAAGADAYLAKFNKEGNCIWATYYGGDRVDWGIDIATDTSGFLYMAGRTNSATGIATVGSHQPTKAGSTTGYDAFLAKFDTSGQRVWGTYYGGTGIEGTGAKDGISVATDRMGRVYLGGSTNSTTGIATTGAHQPTIGGSNDGFLVCFSIDGSRNWATYYGGIGVDNINSISTDYANNIYLGGYSSGSATGISTSGSHQPANLGDNDAFLVKFAPSGTRIWGTFFGGTQFDDLWKIQVDSIGNIFCAGTTNSTSGIATTLSHQSVFGGGSSDGYLSKFNSLGELEWASYYGGNDFDMSLDVYYDSHKERVYLLGATSSPNDIATPNGLFPNLNGYSDVFIASFTNAGIRDWGSYFGGNDSEEGYAISGDTDGNIYFSGATTSTMDLATANAYQSNFGGEVDGMLFRINTCDLPDMPGSITGSLEVCEGSSQIYNATSVAGASAYTWILPPGWSGTSNLEQITLVPGAQSGRIQVAAINACGSSDTMMLDVLVKPAPQPQVLRNGNIMNTTQSYSSYQWNKDGTSIGGETNPTFLAIENGAYTVTVTGANGCPGTSSSILVSDITSIQELMAANGITVYPNPAVEHIYIQSPLSGKATVRTLTGQTVFQSMLHTGITTIETSAWTSGIYLLELRSAQGVLLGGSKVIKRSN